MALVPRRPAATAAQHQDQFEGVDLQHSIESRAKTLALERCHCSAQLARAKHVIYLWHPGQ